MNWIPDYHIELFKIPSVCQNETNDKKAIIIKITMLAIVYDYDEK